VGSCDGIRSVYVDPVYAVLRPGDGLARPPRGGLRRVRLPHAQPDSPGVRYGRPRVATRPPPLDADGRLGPQTWERLRPVVGAYAGAVPAGTRPDWVGPPTPGAAGVATLPPEAVVAPVAHTAEDRALRAIIEEWLRIGEKLETNPYVAVPSATSTPRTTPGTAPRLCPPGASAASSGSARCGRASRATGSSSP